MATQLNNWLSIDKVSGTGNAQITLTASSYKELVDRAISLKIQAQSTNAILNVRQKGVIPKTEEELKQQYFWVEFEEAGGTITFEPNWVYGSPSFKAGKYSDIAYSFDGINWATGTTIEMNNATIVYLENKSGRLNNIDTAIFGEYEWEIIHFNKRARVGGVIDTLSSNKKGCLYHLFGDNTYLTDASKLILPWKTMTERCYEGMFVGCASLTKAPELPATILAYNCYASMFGGCTSLTKAPALSATTLAEKCYDGMFVSCTSLTTAPALPATQLYNFCYESMFSGCVNLVNAPELPATTLEGACYRAMFYNCTSLTTAPVLPAKKLTYYHKDASYFGCYDSMFFCCTSLNYIKMLSEDVVDWHYTSNWVSNVAPIGTFIKSEKSTIEIGSDGIPTGWTVLTNKQEELKQQYFWVEFEEAGGELNFGIGDYTDIEYSFDGNTWNKFPYPLSMGEKRLVYLKNNTKKLSKKGEGNTYSNVQLYLYSKARVGGDFSSMTDMTPYCAVSFLQNQTNLTDASKLILPWKTLAEDCYFNMFYNCTSLTTAPELPATTLANECYYYMFYGCTSLTTAPELPAATLFKLCYYKMFNGCTTLNYIKMLGVDISNTSLKYWVENVAPTGTFVKHPDANIPTGTSGIPDGWTVETATS